MFVADADYSRLVGADYNPRVISDSDIERLKGSLRRFGVIKPPIASGNLIVAGHQRTRALREMGVERGPLVVLPAGMSKADEVWFNQLHNATDADTGDERCIVRIPDGARGFVEVAPLDVDGNFHCARAMSREVLCGMVAKYGPFGCAVATSSGEVIHGGQYALASRLVSRPCYVYVLAEGDEDEARDYLGTSYGKFSYAHLRRDTFVQMAAQPSRDRKSGPPLASPLYEGYVIPWMLGVTGCRVIDFGAGFGVYPKMLRGRGLHVDEMEFFRRVPGKLSVDVKSVHRMVDNLIREVATNGLYDGVVCDVVLNSVDSVEAERAVWAMLNGLCKPGGRVFFSGRQRERMDATVMRNKVVQGGCSKATPLEFFDDDGFTARFDSRVSGRWFYQRYHRRDEVLGLASRNGLEVYASSFPGGSGSLAFRCASKKVSEIPCQELRDAIDFEFDIKIGDDRNLGRNKDVMEAFAKVYGDTLVR